jgi:hypothetical protein
MVIAETTGQPGELLVRFRASQRSELLDALELFMSTAEDGIQVAQAYAEPNPAYLAAKQAEVAQAQSLITTITSTVEPGEDFEVIAPAYLICSCVRGVAGLACERLSIRVDELQPGLDSEDSTGEVRRHQRIANMWLRTLLAVNAFEPVRRPPNPGR